MTDNGMTDNGLSITQKEILKDVLRPFAPKIERVGIFGSRATGKYRDNSDIDLVIYGTLTEQDADRLWTLFDASSLALRVDLNVYSLISYPPLKAHIDQAVVTLFSQEEIFSANKGGGVIA